MVSVIIPAYNAEKTLTQTLDSVFSQTYQEIEVILINDGSTDATNSIAFNYPNKVKVINILNNGVSYARNLGLKHANGKYIQFLDADDLLLPQKLALQVQLLESSNADVAYGHWQRFTQNGEDFIITDTITKNITGNIEIALFENFWCPPAALLYSSEITKKIHWRSNLPIIQDARYLLDAAIAKGKFIFTPNIMALYRDGQLNSLSQKSEIAFVRDCFENCKEVFQIWKDDIPANTEKKAAVINVLRYCINRLSVLDFSIAMEAIDFLLSIEPYYLPKEKGMLRVISKLFGYEKAERLARIKRKLNS